MEEKKPAVVLYIERGCEHEFFDREEGMTVDG